MKKTSVAPARQLKVTMARTPAGAKVVAAQLAPAPSFPLTRAGGARVVKMPAPATVRSETRTQNAVARLQARDASRDARAAAAATKLAARRSFVSDERAAKRAFTIDNKLARPGQHQQFVLAREAQKQATRLAKPAQRQAFVLARDAQKQAFKLAMPGAAAGAAMSLTPAGVTTAPAPVTQLTPAAAVPTDAEVLSPEGEPVPAADDYDSDDVFEQSAAVPQEEDEDSYTDWPGGGAAFENEVSFEDVPGSGDDAELEGLGFPFVNSITAKWDELVAWLQAQAGRFMQIKSQILSQQKVLDAAIAKAKSTGGDVSRLKDLRSRADDALVNQRQLEGKVIEQMQKISATKQSQSGVGILPLVIGAAAVAALAYVVGQVYLQMRAWDQLNHEIEIATSGVMSVTDIERLKKAGAADPFGLGNLKTLALIGLGILVVWKVLPMFMNRRSAA